ncbi:hypothetical protein ACU4GD_31005 [Cupriavidus basilensis]
MARAPCGLRRPDPVFAYPAAGLPGMAMSKAGSSRWGQPGGFADGIVPAAGIVEQLMPRCGEVQHGCSPGRFDWAAPGHVFPA